MKITSVRSFLLSHPFAEPIHLLFHGGYRTILKRDAMLIRVTTDNGLVGYAPGPASEIAHNAIKNTIAPYLEGRGLADPDALRIPFLDGPGQRPDLAKTFAAVEIALYDLVAKAHGVPLSEMIGGRIRDRIRLYGSAGMYMAPEKYAEEAAAMTAAGFRGYKMRLGLGPENDLETIRQMRRAAPDIDLMVDAHTWWRMGDLSYDAATVEQMAKDMSSYRIAWLEEPLPPHDHAAYQRLKQADYLPLASGEHEPDELGYLDLILSESVDYIQMDVCCQGGFSMGRRIFSEIAHQGLRFAFHSWGTALEVLAAAHLGICWPELIVEWLEYPCYSTPTQVGMYPFPLASEILKEPLQIEAGQLVVPRGPGMGIEIDESVIERYPWVPGPWSYFHLEHPPQTLAVTSDHSLPWAGNPHEGNATG